MEADELLKSLNVAFIDDDGVLREEVGRILRRRVKRLYTAADGEEGLALVLREKPDMVITDMEMPVMGGKEMIDRIRGEMPDLPIVVVTAYRDKEHYSEEADMYIYKPVIDLWEFMETLAQVARKTFG